MFLLFLSQIKLIDLFACQGSFIHLASSLLLFNHFIITSDLISNFTNEGSFFLVCSSSPMGASVAWDEVEGFALCASVLFLSLLFSLVFPSSLFP